MLEQMGRKNSRIGLPAILIVSLILGVLLSNLVLSLSPFAGFAVIFGTSAAIIAAAEVVAYIRRKPRGPHFIAVYGEERKRRARGKDRLSEEELVDRPELVTPVEPS